VPHLNKSLARSNKNPFFQGFLTGIVTINLREFFSIKGQIHDVDNMDQQSKVLLQSLLWHETIKYAYFGAEKAITAHDNGDELCF